MDLQAPDRSLLIASVVALLSFIYVYRIVKLYSFWSSRGIKGPTPWPLLGTNIYYLFYNKIDIENTWHKKHGKTFGLYEGSEPVLRTVDNEIIKQVFIKDFSSFVDRDTRFIFGDNIKRWIFFSKGDHWSNQRVLLTPMFTSARMRNMFGAMLDRVNRFKREIASRLDCGSSNSSATLDKSVFSKDELMALALSIIARAFFGLNLDTYKDKTSPFFKKAFAISNFDKLWFIIWVLIPTPISRYFQLDLVKYSQYEYFDKLSQSTIDERRKDASKKSNDFIQALLDSDVPITPERIFSKEDDIEAHYNDDITHEEMEKIHASQTKKISFSKFNDLEIRSQMILLFIAGFETTSSSLSFCFYELAHQQVVQQELYEELTSVPNISGQLEYTDLSNLKKLDAFVSETMRLYTPLIELRRAVTNKAGVTLPTNPATNLPHGCCIGVSALVVQRDSDYWPDANKFDMTRFFPENRDKIKSCTYMPFGLGPRNCVGMRFALMAIKLTLAEVLLKYKVSPGPKTLVYEPEFKQHAFFLQLNNAEFKLSPRESL